MPLPRSSKACIVPPVKNPDHWSADATRSEVCHDARHALTVMVSQMPIADLVYLRDHGYQITVIW